MASNCLSVQFLLVRMTVSTENCPSIHVVYTSDVPPEPNHIRCSQLYKQLPSLAIRSFCVVLAKQRLASATTDNAYKAQNQAKSVLPSKSVPLVRVAQWLAVRTRFYVQTNDLTNTVLCHIQRHCMCRHDCIASVSNATLSTHSQGNDCR